MTHHWGQSCLCCRILLYLVVAVAIAWPISARGEVYDSFEGDGPEWRVHCYTERGLQSVPMKGAVDGDHVLRVEVQKEWPWILGGPRCELTHPRDLDYMREGDQIVISAWVYFPLDYIDDPAIELIMQVHAAGDAVPFIVQSKGADLLFRGRGFDDVWIPKTKGQWMRIEVMHRWSFTGRGSVRIWVNDTQIVREDGLRNIYRDELLYWKFGLYKGGWKGGVTRTTERVLYFDDVRIYECCYRAFRKPVIVRTWRTYDDW